MLPKPKVFFFFLTRKHFMQNGNCKNEVNSFWQQEIKAVIIDSVVLPRYYKKMLKKPKVFFFSISILRKTGIVIRKSIRFGNNWEAKLIRFRCAAKILQVQWILNQIMLNKPKVFFSFLSIRSTLRKTRIVNFDRICLLGWDWYQKSWKKPKI